MAEPAKKSREFEAEGEAQVRLTGIEGGGESTPRKKGHLKPVDKGQGDDAAAEPEVSQGAAGAQGVYDQEDNPRKVYDDEAKPGAELNRGRHLRVAPEPEELRQREAAGEEGAKDGKGGKDAKGKGTDKDAAISEKDRLGLKSGYDWENNTEDGEGEEKGQGKKKFKWTRKRGAIAIVSIMFTALIGGGLSQLQAPLEFIHAAEWLDQVHNSAGDNAVKSRAGRLLQFARTRNDPNRRNLGWKGNLIADYYTKKLAKAGVALDFIAPDGSKSGRVQRIHIDTDTPEGKTAAKSFRNVNIGSDRITVVGNITTIEIGGSGTQGTKATRAILGGTFDAMGMGKTTNRLANRLMRYRTGTSFHQLKNRVYDKGQDLFNYIRGVKEDRSNVIEDGVQESDINKAANGEDATDPNDPDANNNATDADQIANETNELTDIGDNPVNEANIADLADQIKGKLTKGLGVVAVVNFVCAIKSFGDAYGPFMRSNVIEPMIRTGLMVTSIGSQVRSPTPLKKDVNAQELGVYKQNFYDKKSQLGWTAAASVQAIMGKPATGPDLPSSMKPGREKPAFFQFLDSIPGLGNTCSAINSPLGMITLTVVSAYAGGILSVLTDSLTDYATGKAADRFHLFENLARLIYKGGVSTDASGPLFGNIINYGMRLFANQSMQAKGGVKLSAAQAAAVDADSREQLAAEQARKPFLARYFDPKDVNSLVGNAIMTMPRAPDQIAGMFLKSPFQSLGNIFRPAGAQSVAGDYDWGFARYGFSIEDLDNPLFENPYDNADLVEPRLNELNQKYSKCFATSIDPATGHIIPGTTTIDADIPEMCDDHSDIDLLRYRFYLLDTYSSNSLACYSGDDESCQNIMGYEAPSTGNPTTPGTGAAGGMFVGDPYTDGTSVPCPQGTTFVRQDTGYTGGNPFAVNLCSLPNLFEYDTPALVNSRAAPAWLALINAAIAAGYQPGAVSSFRTMAEQEAIFARNGSDPTVAARPGYSSHQAGVAIDFADMSAGIGGQTCDTRATSSNPLYGWLVENAGKFGIKQYSAEAWHWDALPMDNRC